MAAGSSNGHSSSSGSGGSSQQKGPPRIQGLKLPSSWRDFEEVPQGSYIYGQDGRIQQYEYLTEADGSDEVRSTEHLSAIAALYTVATPHCLTSVVQDITSLVLY